MLVYKGVRFSRFARKAGISDEDLIRVVERADQGLVDADLGGDVIKQRITRKSSGAAGSARTLILYRREQRAIFVFGFEKKDMANITKAELQVFREKRQGSSLVRRSRTSQTSDVRRSHFHSRKRAER